MNTICPSTCPKTTGTRKIRANREQLKKNPTCLSMSKVLNTGLIERNRLAFLPLQHCLHTSPHSIAAGDNRTDPSCTVASDNRNTTSVSKRIQCHVSQGIDKATSQGAHLIGNKHVTNSTLKHSSKHGSQRETGASSMGHAN